MEDNSFGYDSNSSSPLAGGTGVGVLRIGKRDYAIGLQWLAVDEPSRAAAEARELASSQDYKADFFCVRLGATPQMGLGYRSQGHKSSMPSLAAHLAGTRGGSWLGLYEAAGGFYMVGVRNDGILSECDRFFDDADEARDAFESFQQQSEWDAAYAPEEFDIPGTVPGTLESIVEGRPDVRLQDVGRSSTLIKVVLAAAVLGFGIFGTMYYMNYLEEIERLEFQRALEQAASSVGVGGTEEEIEIPPMPWEGHVMAVPFLETCVRDVHAFPTDIPAWTVAEIICQTFQGGAAAAAAVDRNMEYGMGGSINWVSRSIEEFSASRGASVQPPATGSGNRVAVGWDLSGMQRIPVDLRTETVGRMRAYMLEHLEERMVRVTFSEADNNEFWRGFNFSFSTGESPLLFADIIGNLPGAMLTSVRFDVSTMEWHLEGKAYEQLPH